MKVTAAVQTDRGRVRGENQDSYGFSVALGLYLVADGMGGRAAGKRASEEATSVVTDAVRASAAAGQPTGGERLHDGIVRANHRVWELAQTDPHLYGMGTTIAAILVEGDIAHIAHVGDSRVYRIRGGAIEALTRDHSVLAELADRGIDLAEEQHRPLGLTRAIGVAPTVEVALASERMEPGDVFVICSDGIYRMVPAAEMQRLLQDGCEDPDRACVAIVARANDAGGTDNSTIIVLCVRPDGASTGSGDAAP